jgi:hypothetical protein
MLCCVMHTCPRLGQRPIYPQLRTKIAESHPIHPYVSCGLVRRNNVGGDYSSWDPSTSVRTRTSAAQFWHLLRQSW